MVQTTPLGLVSNGAILALAPSAVANMGAPTMAELTAVSVVDLSCYLTALEISTTENTVEDVRLCTKQVLEVPGDFTQSLSVTYTYNPPSPANDKARLGLVEGSVKFFVVRYGIDADIPIAVGDFVDVYKFRAGKQVKNTPARNSTYTITQKLFLAAVTRTDVTVVA